MPPIRKLVFLATLLALAAAAPSQAASRTLVVGASESASLIPDSVAAKSRMDLAVLAGLTEIEIRADWTKGKTAPTADELAAFQASALAAQLDAIRLVVAVNTGGGSQTPLSLFDRRQFAQYTASLAQSVPYVRDFIVGNEPNLNRFWMPQFDGRGRDLAASAYEALLARTYDSLKAVSQTINVIGGAVSPRGADRANSARQTHSPTRFLRDLGAAYRKSRRTLPIMDTLVIHPYGESSKTPPTALHPKSTSISIADYPKLVKLLRDAFRGTAQRGASLPILYGEYGVQTRIPADKLSEYTDLGIPSAADAVSETMQGSYYRQAIQLAYCQPTVAGLLFFHVSDEPDLDRWQSGLFYADDTPKSDLASVKTVAHAAQTGTLTCPKAKPKAKSKSKPNPRGRRSPRRS
ncbi:MAG: hypothetical protein E6G19_06835 [Actinobacteria bacterium]|nr:MAG: hypothetical protein E6G19_06835 [Actinomycetota bacterium]